MKILKKIRKQMKLNPKYNIRLCYNNTGEVLKGTETYNIFNNLEECLDIFLNKIK